MTDLNEADFEESGFDLDVYEQRVTQAKQDALRTVEAMNLPNRIHISPDSFAGLGTGTSRSAQRVLTELTEKYGEKLPYLIGIALRESYYAVCDGAHYCAASGYDASVCTPEGYAQSEGWANTMYNGLANLKEDSEQAVFRIETPFLERIPSQILLDCIALYWLLQASNLNQSGDALGAQDLIFEGLDALSLSTNIVMYDAGIEDSREENLDIDTVVADGARKKMLSMAGIRGANSRHRLSAELKKWALDKAAEMRGNHKGIARQLFAQLPAHLTDASKDPERLIYDALRSSAKPN
jgi:hypothetical protein